MKVFRKLLTAFLCFFLAVGAAAIGYYFAVTGNVALSPEKLMLSGKTITLYDQKEAPIAMPLSSLGKQSVGFDSIPQQTKRAFVDAEDKRFFSHDGFDYKRIVKSAYNNFKSHSFKQGASTISQQLIKNTHLSQEKTLKRKLKEWKLTRQLEKRYSKDEILEKYLSVIYFGHNCFGLRAASAFYFGKTPDQLDLADSAILAGLVKSPNNYSPFKNPQNCAKRKESVLNAMLKNGSITQVEKQVALEKPLPQTPQNQENTLEYSHFVFDELSALSEKYGFTLGGNIEIYTYADQALQAQVEAIANTYQETDKTLLVLDKDARGFKACVSSVGEIRRLPGSLLKPLLVYAPAIEENLVSPATPLLDEKINYGGYAPNNYDGKFHGYISTRESLAKSLNIPAVKLLESLGVKKGASYLEKLGLPVEKDELSLALALGGMKNGYSIKDMLSAYSALACGGVYGEGAFIASVKIDGNEVYRHTEKTTRVFSEETAYLTTDMLQTTAKTGTAKKLRSLPFAIAAKTGTVGTDKGNTDAYALSYTSRDLVGVWLGNADNSFIQSTGGGLPCNLLLELNEYLYKSYTAQNERITPFQKPKNVVAVELDKTSYYGTHTLSLADEFSPSEYRFSELFKKDAVPTKKADFFSNPSIAAPSLEYTDGKVIISFEKDTPNIYQYKIERYDYVTHTTVYFGDTLPRFTDENVMQDKTYIYTVTPIYNGRIGKTVKLPAVSTKAGEQPPASNREILGKDWWDY